MNGPERLRDIARFYLQESALADGQKDKEYFADCAFELAQMAEVLERALIDNKDSISSIGSERPNEPMARGIRLMPDAMQGKRR